MIDAIGVDVGGTKLGVGAFAGGQWAREYTERRLPSIDYDELLAAIAEAARDLTGQGASTTRSVSRSPPG